MAPDGQPAGEPPLGNARRWAITVTVMLVSVLQVLDTSVTNVALPHIQGALSAGLDEVSWVLTSYLAANAIALPATGWLTARLGRRRFFLICTALFTVSSFLSAVAPSIEFLIAMRILQGLGGGPIIPVAQAVLWEIFPPHQRGMAMAVWGSGSCSPRRSDRRWGAGSPTTGRGAGSSTSTCPSACSASSWRARS
jgi:DHA2 family multidrug resistance protein